MTNAQASTSGTRQSDQMVWQVCEQIESLMLEVFVTAPLSRAVPADLFLFANAIRSFSYFRGALVLSRMELHQPAAALLRSLLEGLFLSLAIKGSPENLRLVVDSSHHSTRRKLRNLRELTPDLRHSSVTDELLSQLEGQLAAEKKETKPYQWAQLAGCLNLYLTEYAILSAYVHPSLAALEEHLEFDGSGLPVSIRMRSTDELPEPAVARAALIMMAILEAANPKLDPMQAKRYSAIADHLRALQSVESTGAVQ